MAYTEEKLWSISYGSSRQSSSSQSQIVWTIKVYSYEA